MCECIIWQHLTNGFANLAIMRHKRVELYAWHFARLSRHEIGSWNESSQKHWRKRENEGENEQFIFPVWLIGIRRGSFWSQEQYPDRFNVMKIAYRTITKDSVRGLCSCDSTALIEDHSKRACRASHESHWRGKRRKLTLLVFLSTDRQEQSYEIVRTSELDEDEKYAVEALW